MKNRSQDFYELEAALYDEKRYVTYSGKIIDLHQKKLVLELCSPTQGDVVLDIGTGTGRFAIELAKKNGRVIGIDPSIAMIQVFKRKLNEGNFHEDIELIIANAQMLPLRDNSIQQGVSINVLNHIVGYQNVLDEIVRVIQKKGIFVANYPILQSIYFPVGAYVNLFRRDTFHGVYSRWFKISEISKSYSSRNLIINEKRGYFSPPFPLSNKFLRFVSRFVIIANRLVYDSILKYFSGVLFIKAKRT